MVQSSRPRTTDPWHTFAFVSVVLAALVVSANAYVLARDAGSEAGRSDFVLMLSGASDGAVDDAPVAVAKASVEDNDIPADSSRGETDPSSTPSDDDAPATALVQPTPATSGTPAETAPTESLSPAGEDDEPSGDAPVADPPAGEARAAGNEPAPATVAPPVTPVSPTQTAPAPATGGSVDGLTIWSGGDSMSYFMTVALFAAAEARGVAPVAPANYVVSSGLWPGGPYDWFPRIEADMAAFDPDIAVFMVGANDANGAAADPAGYARLVGEAMDLFEGRRVYWVGQPPMGREDLHASIPVVNRIFAEEAAKRGFVTFVETWPIMAEADGSMLWYDDAGTLLRAETDGIHVTPTGGARMAQPVIAAVLP